MSPELRVKGLPKSHRLCPEAPAAAPPRNRDAAREKQMASASSMTTSSETHEHRAADRGTRKFRKRLRVPHWESIKGEPPVSIAPSQAAVLFDVAYAASLQHHALVLVQTHGAWSVLIYLWTALPTVFNWWAISLFLCRYDPGDLLNEFFLIIYMMLVVGQSLVIQDCADCLASRNLQDPCEFAADEGAHDIFTESLTCTVWGGANQASWPQIPFQCWLYALLSVLPRVIHLLNHCRAVRAIQPRGRRDALLQVLELVCVLPLWLSTLITREAQVTMSLFISAVVLECAFIVVEPMRKIYRYLERAGYISTQVRVETHSLSHQYIHPSPFIFALAVVFAFALAPKLLSRSFKPTFTLTLALTNIRNSPLPCTQALCPTESESFSRLVCLRSLSA